MVLFILRYYSVVHPGQDGSQYMNTLLNICRTGYVFIAVLFMVRLCYSGRLILNLTVVKGLVPRFMSCVMKSPYRAKIFSVTCSISEQILTRLQYEVCGFYRNILVRCIDGVCHGEYAFKSR